MGISHDPIQPHAGLEEVWNMKQDSGHKGAKVIAHNGHMDSHRSCEAKQRRTNEGTVVASILEGKANRRCERTSLNKRGTTVGVHP
jgi:hypothetical protein